MIELPPLARLRGVTFTGWASRWLKLGQSTKARVFVVCSKPSTMLIQRSGRGTTNS